MARNMRMKALRASYGISQADLAARVGVTRQTINAVESGEYNPTIALCRAICRALGTTLDDLFWEEGQRRRRTTSGKWPCGIEQGIERSCS